MRGEKRKGGSRKVSRAPSVKVRGNDRFAAFLDAAEDAMVVVGGGRGEIVFVNSHAERLFGYRRDELLGRPVETLVPNPFRHRRRTRRDGSSGDGRARATRSPLVLYGTNRDGTEFPLEISQRRFETEAGVLIAAAMRHTNDRRRAEEQFRGILESAPDAMIILGSDGEIMLVNGQVEKLFGYPRAELLDQPIEMLVPERFRGRHAGFRSGYFARSEARPMGAGLDLFGLRKDGSEFAAEISLSPIDTPTGKLVTAAVRDVTERKRDMEEQNRRMQEANRLKSEFLANMSHELRTPLNAIIGFTKLLHSGKAGSLSETQTEYLGDILNSSKHLLQLINDVLDLAKVESGRTEVQPERVDVARVVGEVKDILRGLAAERRIALSIEVNAEIQTVVIDPRLLKQVLYNYISNALKFTGDEGEVSVRISPCSGHQFRIDVQDTGVGIKTEDLGRLFVEFQQLDSSSTKRYPGTGLGLALTKRIVEAQGGSVEVASTFGKGSTFSALLPREVRATRDPEDSSRQRESNKGFGV